MIDRVGTVNIWVKDYDRAKNFYVNTLGFEQRMDMPMGPDARWVSVAPKGAATEIVLYKADENWQHYKDAAGKSQPLTFNVVDMDALAKDLKSKGVKFVVEPETQPWGKQALILDDDGNTLILVERASY